ncbi:mtDNA inheritance, partitioning of the mitochondrial organelle [Coemansia sp. RSA 2705]|nr:mtDNA inheritance, partitioning of the mitochondrial organelle [Coemansia sp. RSA 2705]
MREVLTLQFGENANYVGAHFWSLQSAYAAGDRVHELFAERSKQPAVPRALVFDAAGSFGALPLEHELQSAGTDQLDEDRGLWAGPTQVHRQPLHKQPRAGASVRFWSDIAPVRYAPHALHAVSGVEFGNSLGEMNSFVEGARVFAGNDARDDALEGSFRVLAEQCDRMQGFHVLADAFGGFAGYAAGFVGRLRDEYPKAPVLLYNVGRTQTVGKLGTAQLADMAVAAAVNAEAVSMSVPLFAPRPDPELKSHVDIASGDFNQTSAFMAANVAQWSHCLHSGQRLLDEIVAQVTQQGYYPLAETLLAPGLRVPAVGSDDSRAKLAAADRLVGRSFVACSDADVGGISATMGQLVADRGTGFGSLVSDRFPASACLSDPQPARLPRSFPRIFQTPGQKDSGPSAKETEQLPVAGMLCTSTASLCYIQQLHGAVHCEQSRLFKEYERESVREYQSTLDRAIDKYSPQR